MNPYLIAAVAAAHQSELERQAGCCTPMAEQGRNLPRPVRPGLRRRLAARRVAAAPPAACCA
jgi:hypothetical protein